MQTVANPWLWAGFIAVVLVLLALDLGIFHREDRPVPAREALSWVVVWAILALAFDGFVWWRFGATRATEFLTGYLIEQSLSVDNLFVFVLVFATFRIPPHLQHRVLFWGILTALVLRGGMIIGGTALLQRFHWMLYLFGAFLLFTGVKLFFHQEGEHEPEHSLAFRVLRRVIPATPELEGHAFFVRRSRRWVATPLFLCLALIEISDVVFALDSVPAIFGVTLDPFIVFTSNIFAILGLRSLYFAIASLIGRFEYLKAGLAMVLVFIGGKMLAARWVSVSAVASLAVVVLLLGGAIAVSLAKTRRLAAAAARDPRAPDRERSGTARGE
jgi:tellurite resistance protein TerC